MQTLTVFDRLLELPENRSALAAVKDLYRSLAAEPPEPTSPLLFLHGPTGSGKTALVGALVEELSLGTERTICRLPTTDFPLPLPPAAREGEPADPEQEESDAGRRLKEARRGDLVIVEDLQHLPPRAWETLVQLIDHRLRKAAPVLVTATSGPRHLAHRGTPFPARLAARLAGGLVVALDPWQPASRLRFLRETATARGLDLPDDFLAWLADHLTAGGRQLEGALNQIESLARLQAGPLDPARLREHFRAQVDRRPAVERIADHVGGYFGVEPRQLKSPGRSRDLLLPRQVSMYLARRLTALSLAQIGAFFGGRDHTTVLHACRKVEQALQTDAALAGAVRRLHTELA